MGRLTNILFTYPVPRIKAEVARAQTVALGFLGQIDDFKSVSLILVAEEFPNDRHRIEERHLTSANYG